MDESRPDRFRKALEGETHGFWFRVEPVFSVNTPLKVVLTCTNKGKQRPIQLGDDIVRTVFTLPVVGYAGTYISALPVRNMQSETSMQCSEDVVMGFEAWHTSTPLFPVY